MDYRRQPPRLSGLAEIHPDYYQIPAADRTGADRGRASRPLPPKSEEPKTEAQRRRRKGAQPLPRMRATPSRSPTIFRMTIVDTSEADALLEGTRL